MDGNDIVDVGGDHDASLTMDMTLPQTPKMPHDPVPKHPSLRESPAKLRREIEELKVTIKKEQDRLDMLESDYQLLRKDREDPNFADALVQTLTWINHTKNDMEKNRELLSDANNRLKSVECEAELRNTGMLYLSSISSLMLLI